jgi:hypothetical protein
MRPYPSLKSDVQCYSNIDLKVTQNKLKSDPKVTQKWPERDAKVTQKWPQKLPLSRSGLHPTLPP